MTFNGGLMGFYGGLIIIIGSNGNFNGIWLMVGPTPLKHMSSSVGMIISSIWKNQIHVPNHQPVIGKKHG